MLFLMLLNMVFISLSLILLHPMYFNLFYSAEVVMVLSGVERCCMIRVQERRSLIGVNFVACY